MSYELSMIIWPDRIGAEEYVAVAERANAVGMRRLWNIDFAFDSFVYNQMALAKTDRISTGSGVMPRWKRHPMLVAQTAAAIERFFPGRLVIGLGSAVFGSYADMWGAGTDRGVARMTEFIDIVR